MKFLKKIKQNAELIIIIFTAIGIFISVFTLLEMKSQRETSYKPKLFVDGSSFVVKSLEIEDIKFPIYWVKKNNDSIIKTIASPSFKLDCYNIGFGTAKNVTLTYSYNLKEFMSFVKKKIDKTGKREKGKHCGWSTTYNKYNNLFPPECAAYYLENEPPFEYCYDYNVNYNRYISYILPVNIDKKAFSISIPEAFLSLLNIYVYENKRKSLYYLDNDSIPKINIKLKYYDISNNLIEETITITTIINGISDSGYAGEFIVNLPNNKIPDSFKNIKNRK